MAVYWYAGENWNDPGEHQGSLLVLDGEIVLHKHCLAGLPGCPADLTALLESGDVHVMRPCTAECSLGMEPEALYFAKCLLRRVFETYQTTGSLPQNEAITF